MLILALGIGFKPVPDDMLPRLCVLRLAALVAEGAPVAAGPPLYAGGGGALGSGSAASASDLTTPSFSRESTFTTIGLLPPLAFRDDFPPGLSLSCNRDGDMDAGMPPCLLLAGLPVPVP
jgi:hypothetical protein